MAGPKPGAPVPCADLPPASVFIYEPPEMRAWLLYLVND